MGNRIICYGDVIDDIVVAPTGPILEDADTPSVIRLRSDGSAANTAAWLGIAGSLVDQVGVIGPDDAERHAAALPSVTAVLREHSSLQTGRIVIIVQNERRDMLTDRGANVAIDPRDVTDSLLDRAGLLHLTGHTLLNDPGFAGVRRLIERCRDRGVIVIVSPGSVGFIEGLGLDGMLQAFSGAGAAFCSGFLHSWTVHRESRLAAEFGMTLAARAIGVLGGRTI